LISCKKPKWLYSIGNLCLGARNMCKCI